MENPVLVLVCPLSAEIKKRHLEIAYTLGYNFTNRFSTKRSIEDTVSLFNIEENKDHYMNVVCGEKFSYIAFKLR